MEDGKDSYDAPTDANNRLASHSNIIIAQPLQLWNLSAPLCGGSVGHYRAGRLY